MFQFVLSILLLSTVSEETATNSIPRFMMVNDGFYRGGQPEGRAGFEYLKLQGIRTVINLRQENDEAPIVKQLGMNYVHLPMSVSVWSNISQTAITTYFHILSNPENYPIFIHCRRGADRTGVMVGFYRIAVQGWDGRKAHSEARGVGMRWWYAGLKKQLYGFKAPKEFASLFFHPAAVQP